MTYAHDIFTADDHQMLRDYLAECAWRRNRTLVLVACVSQKADCAKRAGELYISDWFVKARRYARMTGNMMILSAEHGLLDPNEWIEPYDTTLNTMGAAGRNTWAGNVINQLEEFLAGRDYDRVIVLAGRNYRDGLMDYLSFRIGNVEVPLEGLGIGEQKQKLIQMIEDAA